MRHLLLALFLVLPALAGDEEVPAVDVGQALRESKEFKQKCDELKIAWEEGVVRALGVINQRGGPCEYLVTISPAKAHETVVLLDKGEEPAGKKKRRPEPLNGYAETLNNAFLAAGFRKGEALRWNDETGETFPPSGETVWPYAEWTDAEGKLHRALLSDWLWCWKTIAPMAPGLYVFTGSIILDEGPPTNKKWLGAEVDGLVAAVLNTSTAILDHTEAAGLENGAYEAIPARVPEIGLRITCVFSRKALEVTEKYEPLKLTPELEAEKKRLEEENAKENAKKKAEAEGK